MKKRIRSVSTALGEPLGRDDVTHLTPEQLATYPWELTSRGFQVDYSHGGAEEADDG